MGAMRAWYAVLAMAGAAHAGIYSGMEEGAVTPIGSEAMFEEAVMGRADRVAMVHFHPRDGEKAEMLAREVAKVPAKLKGAAPVFSVDCTEKDLVALRARAAPPARTRKLGASACTPRNRSGTRTRRRP